MTTAMLLVALAWQSYAGLPAHVDAAVPAAAAGVSPAPAHRVAPPEVHKTTSRPRVAKPSGSSLSGVASWYATGRDGFYAAAGPALRRWLGDGWRGKRVTICYRGCIRVTLNDYCPCGERSSRPDKLVDLSDESFRALARLSTGVIRVRVYR